MTSQSIVLPWTEQISALQNASEFQTWKSRPQLIHMQYAMLNEASGASDAPRLAKWQSIVVRHKSLQPSVTSSTEAVLISCKLLSSGQLLWCNSKEASCAVDVEWCDVGAYDLRECSG